MRGLVIGLAGAGAVMMAAFWESLFIKDGIDLTALVLGVVLILSAAGVLVASRPKVKQ